VVLAGAKAFQHRFIRRKGGLAGWECFWRRFVRRKAGLAGWRSQQTHTSDGAFYAVDGIAPGVYLPTRGGSGVIISQPEKHL